MRISLLSIDNTKFYPITATIQSHKVVVYENNQAGTADYLLQDDQSNPTGGAQRPAGSRTVFLPHNGDWFTPNQTVGYIKSNGGAMTFVVAEGSE